MRYFIFDRNSLKLEEILDKSRDDHTEDKFIVLPGTDCQEPFRKTLDRLRVSGLEVALMYRNAGNIDGPISIYRDTLISKLFYLLTTGHPLTKHTVTLWGTETGSQQARTGDDRRAVNTVAPARTPSAPRGGNRVTIFEVADRMWNDAGAPKDVSTVLQLRKTIMVELEANHGIKKTTSSTALGDWQKVRLNG